jgi:hypothetical protein
MLALRMVSTGSLVPLAFLPAGVTADGNEEHFVFHSQAELVRCRIALLSAMGYVTLDPPAGCRLACRCPRA